MADVDPLDLIEVLVKGQFKGVDDVLNVFQARMSDPFDGTAATAVAWGFEWMEDMYDELLANLSSDYEVDSVEVENLTQGTFLGQNFVGKVFVNASQPLPPSVAALVIGNTAEPTIDGRKYLAVFGEDQQDGGLWGAPTKTQLAAFGALWKDPFTSTLGAVGNGQVVTKNVIPGPVGRDIVSIRVIGGTRTQRRRTIGVGS